jgi:hypothetical protein
MLWVEHIFVAIIIARWLWRVWAWLAAAHVENKRCAELLLEARLNAEMVNQSAAQRRENKQRPGADNRTSKQALRARQDAVQSGWRQ